MKNLNSRHKIIMSRLLLGETQSSIANTLGMSNSRISIIVNAPLFKGELRRMESQAIATAIKTSEKVHEIINAGAPDAARKLVEHVDSPDENVSIKASEKVITFSDFGKEHLKEGSKQIVITQQQVALIEEGMK